MFSKARLDTLLDGIFAVAMTLLVLDLRLPEEFQPHTGGELLGAIGGLWPKFLPYVVSFWVLGLRWLGIVELRSRAEYMSRDFANYLLVYLLLITCVPFTTMVVGRYAYLAPAIWLYAGHTFIIALISLRMIAITPHLEAGDHLHRRQLSGTLLALSSLMAVALSFVTPRYAMWAFILTATQPIVEQSRRHAAGGV